MAQAIELAASAARTASGNGSTVFIGGYWKRLEVVLDVTAAAHEVGDTLDVYVDISPDGGTTWINAVHFTQVLGNGGAKKFVAVLDPTNPGTDVIDLSADCAAGKVRPAVWGTAIRERRVIADAGGDADQSFTYSVKAIKQ